MALAHAFRCGSPVLFVGASSLTDSTFKEASWDWVQETSTATTTWGDISVWDVSGVKDFSRAFSKDRNQEGEYARDGNPKAATFVGTGMSKWITGSVTSLELMFYGAQSMNADLSKWDVQKVETMEDTFNDCIAFTGEGLGLNR